MPKLTFSDQGKEGEFEESQRVLDCANSMGVEISQVCGGDGACGTCRIEVIEGWENLTAPTPDEFYKEIEEPHRLSCQSRLKGDVVVRVAKIE